MTTSTSPAGETPGTDESAADRDEVGVLLRWFPTMLLVSGVLIFAIFTSATNAITWTGPGFSMFSHADYRATRYIQMTVSTSDGTFPAGGLYVEDEWDDLIALPTESNAADLAAVALETQWVIADGVARPAQDWEGAATGPATSVQLTLWSATIVDDTLAPDAILSWSAER